MIQLAKDITMQQDVVRLPIGDDDLEKIADEFVDKNGAQSLGDLDTPAFIRKMCNVAIMPPQELLKRQISVEPDPKGFDLVSALRGWDRPLATT